MGWWLLSSFGRYCRETDVDPIAERRGDRIVVTLRDADGHWHRCVLTPQEAINTACKLRALAEGENTPRAEKQGA